MLRSRLRINYKLDSVFWNSSEFGIGNLLTKIWEE
jgi:hypothetical protein